MRTIPASLDPAVVATLDARLADVELTHRVRIAWAVESGSRAWGFPSPDSDYDCRFVYMHRTEHYLSLWQGRDVIETPLDAIFDVNGWDLTKAIRLIAKGNQTAIEWLRSPIIYRGDPAFRDRMLAFAGTVVERGAVGRHYLHVARRQKAGAPTLKRFFYVLRPAATLRWLRDHPGEVLPPMDLPALLAESTTCDEVRLAAGDLIALKAVTRELGDAAPPSVLQRFVSDELARAEAFEHMPPAHDPIVVRARADALFRAEIAAQVTSPPE